MKKIPTLFVRDEATNRKYVKNEVTEGCEWVLAGEGVATRKYDGTCVMFDGEEWWARREVKPGKAAPPNFVPVEHDDTTGKTVGWEPAEDSSFYKYLSEAIANENRVLAPATYELVGPKINGNPEGFDAHGLVLHGDDPVFFAERTFDDLRTFLLDHSIEGIVWHHPDGRMCKLKKRDFPATASPSGISENAVSEKSENEERA